jgi:hypothetical protein
MQTIRSFFRAFICATAALVLLAAPAFAQNPSASPANPIASPAPPKGGLCAPWHSCVAKGTLAAVVLFLLAIGAGYMVQRRGFDKIEHQQGHPEGVKK